MKLRINADKRMNRLKDGLVDEWMAKLKNG